KLFGEEQAYARYTLESIRVQSLVGISQEEKDELQATLKQQLQPGVLPEKPSASQLEWERRYVQFQQEKQRILDAGLTEEDKQQQIERLLSTHFRAHEINAARIYISPQGS
ncbi:MAG: hypothetical protein H7Y02_05770, partial [Candidatus Obscuribacterales bacterium]|nr:hypothetical protein [Steroidobacteraceae bacterium]